MRFFYYNFDVQAIYTCIKYALYNDDTYNTNNKYNTHNTNSKYNSYNS